MVFIYCKLSYNEKWCLRKKPTMAFSFQFSLSFFLRLWRLLISIFPPTSPLHSVCPFSERQMEFLRGKTEFPCLVRGKQIAGDKKDSKKLYKFRGKKDSWFHVLRFPQNPCSVLNPSLFFTIYFVAPLPITRMRAAWGNWPPRVGRKQNARWSCALRG